MKTLVIVAHPERTNSGVQQFLKESSASLVDVTYHYLDEQKPTIDVKAERHLLRQHQRIIFQFPMYWYSAPALLKNWIDCVITEQRNHLNLEGKELGIVISMGLKEEAFQAGGKERFTLSELMRPFEAISHACGMTYLPIFPIYLFTYQTDEEKKNLLIKYQQYVTMHFPQNFASRETWFLTQLKQKMTHSNLSNEQRDRLIQLTDVIKENRHHLTDLLTTLDEMRMEE